MCGRFTTISHEDVVRVVRAMQAELARQQEGGHEAAFASARASACASAGTSAGASAGAWVDASVGASACASAGTSAGASALVSDYAAVPATPGGSVVPATPVDPSSNAALEPRQVRPSDVVPVIRLDSEGFTIRALTWGFPGFDKSGPLFNTRFERAFGNPGMWARPFQEGRCIVCARSFFEPHATETVRSPKTGRLIKAQYHFETGKIMLMAGVSGGDDRFSVVTTEPNAQVRPIHDRMPLLLDLRSALTWLLPGDAWREVSPSALPLLAAAEQPAQPLQSATPQMSLF